MSSLSLFRIPGAILAHAKNLIAGGAESTSPARLDARLCASKPVGEGDHTTHDKTFWASMAGADKRLAELRRAIDEAAAEAMARDTGEHASPGHNSQLGESRCETANRMITDALGTQNPSNPQPK
ncbi:hypothetical protein ACN2C6_06805 [Caulobacter sp. ErkDOM-YI]|uniref:hypothetical protein n=1 Tax=unclassified Caulobacter TaxID=2648921 RepID=UPI003AF95685